MRTKYPPTYLFLNLKAHSSGPHVGFLSIMGYLKSNSDVSWAHMKMNKAAWESWKEFSRMAQPGENARAYVKDDFTYLVDDLVMWDDVGPTIVAYTEREGRPTILVVR